MAVRIEKSGPVWTVIHSRPNARNAMDPVSADALVTAFHSFDADPGAEVAVLWGEGGAFCANSDRESGFPKTVMSALPPKRTCALH
jgi:enoyl-CoA hydratase